MSKRNSVGVLTGTDARPSVPTAVTRPERHDNGYPSDCSDSSDTSDSSDLFPSNLYARLSGQKVFVPLSPLYLLWVAVMCDLVVAAVSYSRVARESYL